MDLHERRELDRDEYDSERWRGMFSDGSPADADPWPDDLADLGPFTNDDVRDALDHYDLRFDEDGVKVAVAHLHAEVLLADAYGTDRQVLRDVLATAETISYERDQAARQVSA